MLDNEIELIRQVQDGNYQRFELLILEYQDFLNAFVLRIVRNAEDAGDVCQETFFKAYKYLKSFKGKSKFSTWLLLLLNRFLLQKGSCFLVFYLRAYHQSLLRIIGLSCLRHILHKLRTKYKELCKLPEPVGIQGIFDKLNFLLIF